MRICLSHVAFMLRELSNDGNFSRRKAFHRSLHKLKIECGEELCWDYSCVTKAKKNFVRLFVYARVQTVVVRFFSFAGSSTFTAVMNEKHNFLHRNAILCRACSEPLTDEDLALLSDFGIRDSALNTISGERAPDWVVKWASLILRYVQLEEKLLPEALCNLPMQKEFSII